MYMLMLSDICRSKGRFPICTGDTLLFIYRQDLLDIGKLESSVNHMLQKSNSKADMWSFENSQAIILGIDGCDSGFQKVCNLPLMLLVVHIFGG